ncbi:kinesin-like protein KIF25 [Clupea harengus]|uniref:Kinesin-like protein KIF25 n=1 Tax=Clupea harengus TaxID=7950 RepID=A0A8M1KT47_CLUHA|nr:kinesin-like protein KIF25 [Clupea harengus]
MPFDHGLGSPPAAGSTLDEVVQAVDDDSVLVNCAKPGSQILTKMFEFERVHGPGDSQEAVFEEVRPLLTSLLDGYNVCIMAYGQTGGGKTHTMIGSHHDNHSSSAARDQNGIIPKAASELFRLISERPVGSHTVEVSVLEVYNNEVLDLLAKDEEGVATGVKRDVITTATGTSEVPCLAHEPVCSGVEVMGLLGGVLRLRAQSPTLVHRDSSRSHLIVTLTVTSRSANALALARRMQSSRQEPPRTLQREFWSPRCARRATAPPRGRPAPAPPTPEDGPSSPASSPVSSPFSSPSPSPRPSISQEPIRTRLQLVDLAGSECHSCCRHLWCVWCRCHGDYCVVAGVSGVSGAALWESSCINRSLSALSDVLGALAEQRPHVPYRNSKLTHLLQDSIGGDAKLLVMLCVSPTQHFLTESLQSLGFGARARQVQRGPPRRKNTGLKIK